MSLTTGHQDVLIQVRRTDALVDALSPAGFRWLTAKYSSGKTQRVPNSSQFIGNLVSDLLAARLTIAVRSDTLQTIIDEDGNSFSASEIELRPDAPREAVPEMRRQSPDNDNAERQNGKKLPPA